MLGDRLRKGDVPAAGAPRVYRWVAAGAVAWYLVCLAALPEVRPGILEVVVGLLAGSVVARLLEPYWFAYLSATGSRGGRWAQWAPLLSAPTMPFASYLAYRLIAAAVTLAGGCVLAGILIWVKWQFPHLAWPLSRLEQEGEIPGFAIAAAWIIYMATAVVLLAVLSIHRWNRLSE